MKWMVFVLTLLAATAFNQKALGKTPRTLTLSESEVATVTTALGYTTMLQFDGRPTSAVLGDQDAFKVEYVGNGLAIKPMLPHAKTNLFVFTDYDRFNFKLATGAATEADYILKIRRPGYINSPAPQNIESHLTKKSVKRKSSCGGLSLGIEAVAWPKSRSNYLIQFISEAGVKIFRNEELKFEPGDFVVSQDGVSLPIESLHLNRLALTRGTRTVQGTLVLKQAAIRTGPIQLGFFPDFHRVKHPGCPRVSFSLASK